MDRLEKTVEWRKKLVFVIVSLTAVTGLLSIGFAVERSPSIDDLAKLVNESEKKKLEVSRILKENKKAYDLLEKELAHERKTAGENLIKLHRAMAFRRLLSRQKITCDKIWWNAELAFRSAVEESLRRQTAYKIQMAELDRLERALERNLRELVDAETVFRKNLHRLVAMSREILKRRMTEKREIEEENESLRDFFQNRLTMQAPGFSDNSRSTEQQRPDPAKEMEERFEISKSSIPKEDSEKGRSGVLSKTLLLPVEEGIMESSMELKKSADSVPMVYSKGVFIRAKNGMPVRAVADGQVVYAGWFREFGRTVIIDHGNHYFSVIAYLGSVEVNEGSRVRQGDIIGEVGQTEILSESGIYFEWRHNGKPLDVKQWFALKNRERKGD